MDLYTYKKREEPWQGRILTRYHRKDLLQLTTLQLRDICYKERIVVGMAKKLDRNALIEQIMKYRGINENAFICDYDETNWDRLSRNIKRFLTAQIDHDNRIQIPAKMIFFQNLAVTELDNYIVNTSGLVKESNVLLVDDNLELYGIFNLTEYKKQWYLTAKDGMIAHKQKKLKHYNLLFFGEHESIQLYEVYYGLNKLLPAQLKFYKVVSSDMRIEELFETDMALAIDFGSTNTSAGAFLERGYVPYLTTVEMQSFNLKADSANLVKFPTSSSIDDWAELIPTCISVKDCLDSEKIIYRYGHDALDFLHSIGYNTASSHFHEVKRWVNDIKYIEELVDEFDHVCKVERAEILGQFLRYIIHAAQQQFKCKFKRIHFSSPVRLQSQFMQMFQDILPEYNLIVDEALDEGMSVLYNSISDLINRGAYEEAKPYSALILDCGGSTTDLSSCTFAIENGRIAYDIDIKTTFEYGNINFGGNNLTYRIMQYLKVLFYEYYSTGSIKSSLKDMLASDSFHAYRFIDDNSINAFYKNLDILYEQAEKYIPTRFGDYRHAPRSEYQAIHSNFYFLWFVAEKLKFTFFETGDIFRSTFHKLGLKDDEYDLRVTPFEPWSLNLKDNNGFTTTYEYPKIIFNVEEIKHLMQADVYYCMKDFLELFYEQGKLNDYSMIRMVGQSCKIETFKDSIKEFVPGKRIRFSRKMSDEQNLKLSCLKGAISYLNDRRMGRVNTDINNTLPYTPYQVTALTHDERKVMLISSLERLTKSAGFVSRPIHTREIEFDLKDAQGELLYTYQLMTDFSKFYHTDYTEVNGKLSDRIRQDDVDNIRDGEIKFFVFAYANWWGFYVLPIARHNSELYADKRVFFSFENEKWENDFFDGFH